MRHPESGDLTTPHCAVCCDHNVIAYASPISACNGRDGSTAWYGHALQRELFVRVEEFSIISLGIIIVKVACSGIRLGSHCPASANPQSAIGCDDKGMIPATPQLRDFCSGSILHQLQRALVDSVIEPQLAAIVQPASPQIVIVREHTAVIATTLHVRHSCTAPHVYTLQSRWSAGVPHQLPMRIGPARPQHAVGCQNAGMVIAACYSHNRSPAWKGHALQCWYVIIIVRAS
mmetsp:Transcript_52375/g.86874  ORF Transcript_52375/g.86874 Transcript_52375/m.86874 type:complete len:232 (+) Transcript_52375:20-715(+)